MKNYAVIIALGLFASMAGGAHAQDFLDRVDETLTFTTLNGDVRTRVSGTLDLEAYHFSGPDPASSSRPPTLCLIRG